MVRRRTQTFRYIQPLTFLKKMHTITLIFNLHQPFRLKKYRFFDIGNDHYYYDDFENEEVIHRNNSQTYEPANRLLLDLLQQYPQFKVSFVLSGTLIEQLELYAPETIRSFQKLVQTGRVDFLAAPYAHSVASLFDEKEFEYQMRLHTRKIQSLFGVEPSVSCNTELIYNDEVALTLERLGYKGVLTEGARHILGWKSPNLLYTTASSKPLKLLLRNSLLSDKLQAAFGRYDSPDYPYTVDKLLRAVNALPENEQSVILYMDYEVMGTIWRDATGIFDFFRALPRMAVDADVRFATAAETALMPATGGTLSVQYPISIIGEAKDTAPWLGNELQKGVQDLLLKWGERVRITRDNRLLQDWLYLQSADHLYYMSTRRELNGTFSPYESPFDAFNNYVNVFSDFLVRLETEYPSSIENEELNALLSTIDHQNERIKQLTAELDLLKKTGNNPTN